MKSPNAHQRRVLQEGARRLTEFGAQLAAFGVTVEGVTEIFQQVANGQEPDLARMVALQQSVDLFKTFDISALESLMVEPTLVLGAVLNGD